MLDCYVMWGSIIANMLKLEIKIKDSCKDSALIEARLDKGFLKYGLDKEVYKDGTICYKSTNSKKDYAVFGMLIYSLHNKSWFIPYVEKWLWYNSDNNEDVNDYNIEDLLYHYTKRESIE